MKYITKYIKHSILLLVLLASGCTDWLDGALPKDRNLEEKQFSTEAGINSVMNGIYRNLASVNLYGGRLTMTDIELLAHYYFYENAVGINAGYLHFFNMSNYKYTEKDAGGAFSSIWTNAYQTIFFINTFIKNIEQSEVISETKKKILLGEAHGLRAFIHFDLFRLFSDGKQELPYNRSAEVIPHGAETINNFYNLLIRDIDMATELLQNDPVRSEGIKDMTSIGTNENVPTTEIFASYLRNYRMNYYAVQALKARILMYKGDVKEASTLAENVLDQSFGTDKPFNWADKNKILEDGNRDYIFYTEIMFGIFNPDMYRNWTNWTNGTTLGSTYTVLIDNLQENIFKNDNSATDMSLWEDVRSRQWMSSKIGNGQYVSCKFEHFEFSKNNPKEYFQPLIRTSELHYIIAEAALREGRVADAVRYLNNLRFMRGSQYGSLPDPEGATATMVYDILETEHYKEFYGEGQTFFYLKRMKSDRIFNVAAPGKQAIPPEAYRTPLPENEISN
ncbi:MAG: RagB/SusD family nutrient uptake outer membrane protein [Dysgonamonadaceae bacterium]|jgi:hypothetical protein|nr:RagB/SusD family nutrient uptake outer membrane protein [Dysgonamonadaceae bacterium]